MLTQTDPELIERIDNFAFDEVIAESDLDIRTRLMVQLASMIGCQAVGEFRVMAGAGLTVGLAVQKQIVGGERVDASRSPATRTPSMPYEPSTRSPLPTATKGQAHDRSLSIHHQDCRRGRGGDCRRLRREEDFNVTWSTGDFLRRNSQQTTAFRLHLPNRPLYTTA